MTIRITGMNSGLDTDAIIQELVSAYRVKGDKIKKNQTKLSWTQDKWKALNTKVVKLYKSLDNLRFTAGYNMKKTSVSDTTKATVSASSNAINGTQSLRIKTLAKGGYLTGAQLTGNKKGSAATLTDLGYTGGDSAKVKLESGGVTKELELKGNTTISDFVKQINESGAGVSASYDETNKRLFIVSKETGKANDFTLTGLDADGTQALSKLGVNVDSATSRAEAATWMSYYKNGSVDTTALEDDLKKLAQAKYDQEYYAKDTETKQAENSKLSGAVSYLNAKKSNADVSNAVGAKNAVSLSQLANMSDADRDKTYIVNDVGELVEATQAQINDPSITTQKGTDYYTTLKATYGINETEKKTDDAGNEIEVETEQYQKIRNYNANKSAIDAYEKDQTNIDAGFVLQPGEDLTTKAQGYTDKINDNNKAITSNQEKLDNAAKTLQTYRAIDSDKVVAANSPTTVDSTYVQSLEERVKYFASIYKEDPAKPGEYILKDTSLLSDAKKVDATDAEIYLNDALFTSNTNTFNINGLTVQALATTGNDEITITTDTDKQGLYDKIKDFLTEYNSIISEMSALYNADSAKGYEPLTSEEKEALSESEIADWEKKIKDSLLRRDGNLSSLISTMTSAMSSTVEIDGKKYSLASLGIKTDSYFNTTATTRYMYHIDGDPDDETTSANADKLMAMLNSDPEKVMKIMQGVTNKLYDNLNKQMRPTTLRTYQTIYNDKAMATSYSDYTKQISAWEEKVAKIEDSYYKQFAAMETALAKLQSQQSALAGLLGS